MGSRTETNTASYIEGFRGLAYEASLILLRENNLILAIKECVMSLDLSNVHSLTDFR
jgi:hypothetical protein